MIRYSRNGSIIAGVYEWLLVVAGEVWCWRMWIICWILNHSLLLLWVIMRNTRRSLLDNLGLESSLYFRCILWMLVIKMMNLMVRGLELW